MTKTIDGKPTGLIELNFSDEIIDAATLTHNGQKRERGK
jgi:NAD(P) transhydrogenase subunit alpha